MTPNDEISVLKSDIATLESDMDRLYGALADIKDVLEVLLDMVNRQETEG